MIYVVDHKHPHVNDLPAHGPTRILTDEESSLIMERSIPELVPEHYDVEFIVYRHIGGELRLLKAGHTWPPGTPVRG